MSSTWIARLRSRIAMPAPQAARDPRFVARVVLAALLVANLVALWFVVKPLGGSPEELEAQLGDMRRQFTQRKAAVDRLRALVGKVEKARVEGDQFESIYFTNHRVASSTMVSELARAAKEVGIKSREHAFATEPVEGSDSLSMMTITANYEGTYADLIHFVNRMDRSTRFLIIESLTAAPQQSGVVLGVNMRLIAFVRDAPLAENSEPASRPESEKK